MANNPKTAPAAALGAVKPGEDNDYFKVPPKPSATNVNVEKKKSEAVVKDGGETSKKPAGPTSTVNKPKPKSKKAQKKMEREKMRAGDCVKSDDFKWRVIKLLGSGGFGDVYKVVKENNPDTNEYAMKTEMVEGVKLMLRLKIEVQVLKLCNDTKKEHFIAFVDRGKNNKFKYMVMGLVGPSLEDIRKKILLQNYSKATAMNSSIQTFLALRDLHDVGYLHRDIKPQNYAVGIGPKESTIFILDFGIARKFTLGKTKEVKMPRKNCAFLGTLRFASRACHQGVDQGRKDDLEAWFYMALDLFDEEYGLLWKRAIDRDQVLAYKLQLFKNKGSGTKVFKRVPADFVRILSYIDEMKYADEPDYEYIHKVMLMISQEQGIKWEKTLDWAGQTARKKEKESEEEETEEDMKQNDEEEEEEEDEKPKKAQSKMKVAK